MTKYEWAFIALKKIEKYLNKNNLIPSEERRDPEKLRIALLGNTQIGKTTLALRLLGATGDELEELSKELRGKRKTGKSATAIASIYYALKDHYRIEIFEENEKKFSWEGNEGSKFEEKMSIIRHKFLDSLAKDTDDSNSDEFVNLLLKIGLPIDSNNNIMSEIIDLVGLNAKSEWERFASKKIADKWIKNCDIPILVIQATKLPVLKSQNFIELFNAWKNYPLKKKLLITTWSYDERHTRDMLDDEQVKSNCEMSYKKVKEKLSKNIIDNILADDNLKRGDCYLYPVTVTSKDKDYQNASEHAVKKLEEDIKSIEIMGTKLFRLKQAFLYKHTVSEIISNKQKENEESIHLKELCINDIKHKINKCEEDIKKIKNKSNELQKRYSEIIEDINTKIIFKKPEIEVDKSGLPYKVLIKSRFNQARRISIPRKCKSVLNEFDAEARIIKKHFKVNLKINKNVNNLTCLRNAANEFDGIMKTYTFPWIWTKKKKELVKQNFYNWIDEKQKLCSREIQNKFKKDNDSLIKREVKKLKKKIDNTKQQKVFFNKNLRKKKAELKEMNLKYRILKKEFSKSEKIVNQYDESLCIAYKMEREGRLSNVKKSLKKKDTNSMVKNIAYLYQLIDEAKYLRSGE